jgi:hypothetical protein
MNGFAAMIFWRIGGGVTRLRHHERASREYHDRGSDEDGESGVFSILRLASGDFYVRYEVANSTGDIARVERTATLVSEGPEKQQILRCVPRRSKNERGKKARDSAQDDRVRV